MSAANPDYQYVTCRASEDLPKTRPAIQKLISAPTVMGAYQKNIEADTWAARLIVVVDEASILSKCICLATGVRVRTDKSIESVHTMLILLTFVDRLLACDRTTSVSYLCI